MSLVSVRAANPHLRIAPLADPAFALYGRQIDKYDFIGLKNWAREHVQAPEKGGVQVNSCPEMEAFKARREFGGEFFGEMDVQIGYCCGHSQGLNALEYHKTQEVHIAMTDYVIWLGHLWDMDSNTYPSAKAQAFFLPRFTTYELFSATLHSAPCALSPEGFVQVLVHPRGGNRPLERLARSTGEDALLWARNTWRIVHPECPTLKGSGAWEGIVGDNMQVSFG